MVTSVADVAFRHHRVVPILLAVAPPLRPCEHKSILDCIGASVVTVSELVAGTDLYQAMMLDKELGEKERRNRIKVILQIAGARTQFGTNRDGRYSKPRRFVPKAPETNRTRVVHEPTYRGWMPAKLPPFGIRKIREKTKFLTFRVV